MQRFKGNAQRYIGANRGHEPRITGKNRIRKKGKREAEAVECKNAAKSLMKGKRLE